ncbi:retrotransposon protein, putative, unclassified [Tanacetum coccineum]
MRSMTMVGMKFTSYDHFSFITTSAGRRTFFPIVQALIIGDGFENSFQIGVNLNPDNLSLITTQTLARKCRVQAISDRFANTSYDFFLGKREAYLVVDNYVRNAWGKYGLVKSMLNSSTRIFSFQFSSMEGLDAMLENGQWFISKNSLILKKWNPDVNLLKEDVGNVPVQVKLHGKTVNELNVQ